MTILVALAFRGATAWAVEQKKPEPQTTIQAPLLPVARFATPHCGATFWSFELQKNVCLSPALWTRWIHSPHSQLNIQYAQERVNRNGTVQWVIQSATPIGDARVSWELVRRFEQLRHSLSVRLESHDPHGIFRRLTLGERREPTEFSTLTTMVGLIHVLNATGIHLYALSGLLLSLMIAIGEVLLNTNVVPRAHARQVRRAAQLLSAAVWCWGWMLSGLRPGMLRPLVVVALRTGARCWGIRWTRYAPLAISLCLDAVVGAALWLVWGHPAAQALGAGRWMYALAVGGGLAAVENRPRSTHPKWAEPIRAAFAMAWGSWVGVALLEVFTSHHFAPWTPLLSLISVPLFASVIYPVALFQSLFTLPAFDALFWGAAERVYTFLAQGILSLSPLWIVDPWRAWAVLPLAVGMASAHWPGASRRICLGVILRAGLGGALSFACFALLAQPLERPLTQITQLNVGQGDSAWLRIFDAPHLSGKNTFSRHFLIDTGGIRASHARNWVERAAHQHANEIDTVILSHWDEDHSGGLLALMATFPLRRIVVPPGPPRPPDPPATPASSSALPHASPFTIEQRIRTRANELGINLLSADAWTHSARRPPAITVRDLSPPHAKRTRANANMNGVTVTLPHALYVNLGDAPADLERRAIPWLSLVRTEVPQLPVLLKASHHGSRTSSTHELLKLLEPEEIWISVGRTNTFGHPSPEVLDRFRQLNVPIERTDRDGNLSR